MSETNWDNLGNEISRIVNDAVEEKNYSSLNDTIGRILNDAIDSGSDALKSILNSTFGPDSEKSRQTFSYNSQPGRQTQAMPVRPEKKTAKRKKLYASMNSPMLKSIGATAAGGALALAGLVRLILAGSLPGAVIALAIGGIGLYLIWRGSDTIKKVGRFRRYQKELGDKGYTEIKKLSSCTGQTEAVVFKDLTQMIRDGWFLEGHIDEEKTTLMVDEEIWQQYLSSHEELIRQQKKAQAEKAEQLKTSGKEKEKAHISGEAADILKKGEQFVEKLHQCNDRIPGARMTEKLSRMELLVRRILDVVRDHPEVAPDLKKLMNYYLPISVKLLDAYIELEEQPVQGENITKAKTEIEQTIDTLNLAFEKLLDSIFQRTVWDVSSDISVLNTMLAQEGLTGGDFTAAAGTAGGAAAAAPGSDAAGEKDAQKIELTL